MTEPLDDRSIVAACPECHRIIWRGSVCHHGRVPPPEPKPNETLKGGVIPEKYKKPKS